MLTIFYCKLKQINILYAVYFVKNKNQVSCVVNYVEILSGNRIFGQLGVLLQSFLFQIEAVNFLKASFLLFFVGFFFFSNSLVCQET